MKDESDVDRDKLQLEYTSEVARDVRRLLGARGG
jgi:hypothetical protein